MAESPLLNPDTPPSSDEVDRLVTALKNHAPTVRQSNAAQRKAKLQRLSEALMARRDAFYEALKADFRKAPVEVDLTEIKTVTNEIDHAVRHLDDWMAPEGVRAPLMFTGTRSTVHYEPKGTVLIMSPWNYPVNLTLGPLVGAIAAGNTVVLKPSEHVPHTANLLQELIGDLYDEREITLVTGGPDVAESLTAQPFDHIYFTGSATIGRKIMKAAAEHLASVTLELGGKSPAFVDDTADLDRAAARIAWSKFTNAGQTCIAPDYVLVQERVHDAFLDRLRETIHRFYGTTPHARHASADYARLIHDDHFDKITRLLGDATARGATVPVGGQYHEETNYVAPTVLTDVPLEATMMQEEIFGPLLPILSFQTRDEAVTVINERAAPLSLYLFTQRESSIEAILNRTTAGSTCVNEGFIHFLNPHLPFGGKGESGIGRAHGRRTFREFSNERAVLRRTFGSDLLDTLYPPYDQITRRVADWVLRYF